MFLKVQQEDGREVHSNFIICIHTYITYTLKKNLPLYQPGQPLRHSSLTGSGLLPERVDGLESLQNSFKKGDLQMEDRAAEDTEMVVGKWAS